MKAYCSKCSSEDVKVQLVHRFDPVSILELKNVIEKDVHVLNMNPTQFTEVFCNDCGNRQIIVDDEMYTFLQSLEEMDIDSSSIIREDEIPQNMLFVISTTPIGTTINFNDVFQEIDLNVATQRLFDFLGITMVSSDNPNVNVILFLSKLLEFFSVLDPTEVYIRLSGLNLLFVDEESNDKYNFPDMLYYLMNKMQYEKLFFIKAYKISAMTKGLIDEKIQKEDD